MKRIRQINNLIIKQHTAPTINYFGFIKNNPLYNRYAVFHGSICLEDNLSLEQAIDYCNSTKDFVRR